MGTAIYLDLSGLVKGRTKENIPGGVLDRPEGIGDLLNR